MDIAARRYIKAILQIWEISELKTLIKELEPLSRVFDYRDILSFLDSPYVPFDRKQEFVLDFVKEGDLRVKNLIKLLLKNGRISLIPVLQKLLQEVINQKNKTYNGVVYSIEKLDNQVIEGIRDGLVRRLGVELELSQEITQKKGIFLEIDSLGIEVSFSNENFLKDLKSHIIKAI